LAGLAALLATLVVVAVVVAVELRGGPAAVDDPAQPVSGTGTSSGTTPEPTSEEETEDPATTTTGPGPVNPGGPTPPEPTEVDQATKEAAFGGDTDLLEFAGPAVGRAVNCADPGGSARALLGLRTQVQCVYRLDQDLYYASFLSSDVETSCGQLGATMTITGRDVSDGTWDGGGRSGTWKDATLSTPSTTNATFYTDSGGLLCGIVESADENPLDLATIHAQWDSVVRPGS
ncbi:MAG TPA: hypothetical protein VGD67_06340, partial [Pseudonocardiaceae bacterium]